MNIIRDLGFGLRQILRRPGFSLVIILTLAVGIGPNVAIFSVLKALVLEPLPYPEPWKLVQVWETDISRRGSQPFSYPDFRDLREQNQCFSEIGVYQPRSLNIGGDEPERVLGAITTAGAVIAFGVPPALGRVFNEEEVEAGERLAILSDSLWRRRFDADPGLLGESIVVNGADHQVVGVMPPHFEFHTPWTSGQEIELWTPLRVPDWATRSSHWLLAVGRLAPDVNWRSAESEIRTIAGRLQEGYPETNTRTQMWLKPFFFEVIGGMSAQMIILIAAVGFVLLTACANIASMLLARAADRKTEVAIRGCLGAGKGRIMTQLLTESALLSLIGGAIGLLLTIWSLDLLKSLIPPEVPRAAGIQIDAGVLLFSLALTVLTGLIFGLAPAIFAIQTDIASTLREGSGTVSGTRRRSRWLRSLGVAQLAVAFMLTNGAILLFTSYRSVLTEEQAFDTDPVLTARVVLPPERYPTKPESAAFLERLLEEARAIPGVESAGITSKLPLRGGTNSWILTDGQVYDREARRRLVEQSWVSPEYFQAMGISLLAGAVFDSGDGTEAERTAVVNQAMVDLYWADQNPIGKTFRQNSANPEWSATVVGVVASARQWGPTYRALPEMYFPLRLAPPTDPHLVIRTDGDPVSLVAPLQRAVLRADPTLPLSEAQTMRQVLIDRTRGREFLLRLVSLFALIALGLSLTGVFGTMSYNVAQRTREIGVRVVFGADRRRILAMVLREGLAMAALGMGIGVCLLTAFNIVLASQLYGIGPVNLVYFCTSAALMGIAALAASILPALRASRVDPMSALRFE